MIDVVGLRKWFALLSLGLLVPCLGALAIWQLNPGIDFQGGLELEVRFLRSVTAEGLQAVLDGEGLTDADVTPSDEGMFLIGTAAPDGDVEAPADIAFDALAREIGEVNLEEAETDGGRTTLEIWFPAPVVQNDVRGALRVINRGGSRIQATGDASFKIRAEEPEDEDTNALLRHIQTALEMEIGPLLVLQSDQVSGVLSTEFVRNTAIALVIAAVAILIYISLAFRRMPTPLLYGTAAIIALLHDIAIVIGVFAILGEVAGQEVDAIFITALLAIIGYSVNDTIVVFDRIRENLQEDPGAEFRYVVNAALTQTLARSLNTSLTVILALVALVLIGGVTVRPFVLALLVGAVAGTYSSIAVASQIVVLWEEGTVQRWFSRSRTPADTQTV